MDHGEDHGSPSAGQNLHDLQNYLVTFQKEMEPGDDVLSAMDVDTEVNDLYNSRNSSSLHDPVEQSASEQFSSGFYTEQSKLKKIDVFS